MFVPNYRIHSHKICPPVALEHCAPPPARARKEPCTQKSEIPKEGNTINTSSLCGPHDNSPCLCLQLKAYVAGYFTWPRNRASANELQQLCMLAKTLPATNVTMEQCEAAIKELDSMPWLFRLPAIHSLVRTVTWVPCITRPWQCEGDPVHASRK